MLIVFNLSLLKTFIQSKRKEDKKSKFHVTYLIVGENKQNKVLL